MTVLDSVSVPPEVARLAAAKLARDVLLRSWIRETGTPVRGPGPVMVDLPTTGNRLHVDVVDRAPTGAHVLGVVATDSGAPLSLPAVVDLLAREAAARTGRPDATEARDRVMESARRLEEYAVARSLEDTTPELPRWLLAEQDLISGHPWHPMTKSRDGLMDDLDARYAPEARGSFPIHWYAAAPAVAAWGSAGLDVPALMRRLSRAGNLPDGWIPVPAHPWQADDLRNRPAAAALLESGLLREIGPVGAPWWATSSLRTVGRPGSEVMLKLSMGLRVTNSRRENTRAEGLLAAHTARLVEAGLGRELAAAHPAFGLVLDRGWLGVDGDGPVGLETVVRDVPFGPEDDVRCAGSLFDPRPDLVHPPVLDVVARSGRAAGLPVEAAAEHWLRRYLAVVVEPLLWLHGTWGVGLEGHLQNVLVGLDSEGLPERGWYRDNQGWYAADSQVGRLATLWPDVGRDAPLVYGDRLVVDRVAYYVGVNHVLGVVAALAAACRVPEERLLRVLADALRAHLASPMPSAVAELLLEAETLPTKANLLTAVDGRDEVNSPVETQSVYVDVPNPLHEVLR
jgi:siderophore synthetase component